MSFFLCFTSTFFTCLIFSSLNMMCLGECVYVCVFFPTLCSELLGCDLCSFWKHLGPFLFKFFCASFFFWGSNYVYFRVFHIVTQLLDALFCFPPPAFFLPMFSFWVIFTDIFFISLNIFSSI